MRGKGKRATNDITLECQINKSTGIAFLDFFPHPTRTFSTLLVYLAPKSNNEHSFMTPWKSDMVHK